MFFFFPNALEDVIRASKKNPAKKRILWKKNTRGRRLWAICIKPSAGKIVEMGKDFAADANFADTSAPNNLTRFSFIL